jgi:hypothetical protein
VLARRDLELVGVRLRRLEGWPRCRRPRRPRHPDGRDRDALLALQPDCVVYMPLAPNVEEISNLLRHGVNIVSSAMFLNGRSFGEEATATIDAAGQAGGASIFGRGMKPWSATVGIPVTYIVNTRIERSRQTCSERWRSDCPSTLPT